ncbi:hypothetical protein EGR_05666 [Echinococcus granulosus]|uniref:Uncharacterized protein n=1 Tax=Echinococcus granulosus TaxID=6210 RepID=W6UF61_ECHGR|nr:hypothetical protein EGR_05666 [Echinococcus granulosus]EUB59516.1 hypothetical protein EGR_05666 [Echinococcus granulosus]
MVAPNSEFGIRPCAVLLNNDDVVNYELQQKKYYFLAGVDLRCGQSTDKNVNEKSKKGLRIPDHKTKSYHVKKRKRERDMFYRRSIRLSRQGFLNHRRGTRHSVYFKLRRHLIENFRAGLVTKISCNNCYVKLTPLDLSNYIYTDSSDTATISTDGGSEGIANDSTSSQSSTISSADEDVGPQIRFGRSLQIALPPLPIHVLDQRPASASFMRGRTFEYCFKVRSGSQSLIGISGVKRGAMLLFNFLYALLLSYLDNII